MIFSDQKYLTTTKEGLSTVIQNCLNALFLKIVSYKFETMKDAIYIPGLESI